MVIVSNSGDKERSCAQFSESIGYVPPHTTTRLSDLTSVCAAVCLELY
jgi:hypothetical protein